MKAWIEGPGGFDSRDGRAENSRTPLEDLSASFTPGRVRFFSKDQAPDALAAMTADLALADYRQLLIDSTPGVKSFVNDASRPFGRYGVEFTVLGEVAVSEGEETTEVNEAEAPPEDEAIEYSPDPPKITFADLLGIDPEAIRRARIIDGSSGVVPLGDGFRAEGTHMHGNQFPPTNQPGTDI